jgi:solute:Na+ symporter, SSS family
VTHAKLPEKFPLNGTMVAFVTMLIASSVYMIVSLATCTIPFDLDRMLHRGKYAPPGDPARNSARRSLIARMANIDESFTRRDRWVAMMLVGFTILLAAINGTICLLNLFGGRWTLAAWARYWMIFGVAVPFVAGTATFFWFTIGGVRDTRDFFRALRSLKRDAADDGRVPISGEDAKRAMEAAVPVVATGSAADSTSPRSANRNTIPSTTTP